MIPMRQKIINLLLYIGFVECSSDTYQFLYEDTFYSIDIYDTSVSYLYKGKNFIHDGTYTINKRYFNSLQNTFSYIIRKKKIEKLLNS